MEPTLENTSLEVPQLNIENSYNHMIFTSAIMHIIMTVFNVLNLGILCQVLLGILQQRIELDKECMFQYTQLRKEVRGVHSAFGSRTVIMIDAIITARMMVMLAMLTMVMVMMIMLMPRCEWWMVRQVSPLC